MKFLLALSTLCALAVLATAYPFAYSPYSTFTGDFGGPSAFGGAFPSASLISDNRGNRGNQGPVVFPMPPSDGPMETSGVVIGASGFGFVPPNGGSAKNRHMRKFVRFKGEPVTVKFNGRYYYFFRPEYYVQLKGTRKQ